MIYKVVSVLSLISFSFLNSSGFHGSCGAVSQEREKILLLYIIC